MKQTDEALVLEARLGNSEALEKLILKYIPFVRYRITPYKALGMEIEDLEQEALIELFKAIRKFNPLYDNSFKTFAHNCINNKIISCVKSYFRNKNIPMISYISLNELDIYGSHIHQKSYSPEEIFIENENILHRKKQITSLLSELEQETLRLYLNGYSYSLIADGLNLKPKTIDNSLQKIRRKLRSVENNRTI